MRDVRADAEGSLVPGPGYGVQADIQATISPGPRKARKAGVKLGVSTPSISEVIAALEHALGARLFDRSPQGVVTTPYGDALLVRADLILLERLVEAVAGPRGPQLVEHRLIRWKQRHRRWLQARSGRGGADLLTHHRMVGDQDVGKVAHRGVLRSLQRELR